MNTVRNQIEVTRNSYKDEGEGVVSFANGLIISDDQVQRNGTRYDIDTLDISKYQGQLTADHEDKLKNIIGRVEGVKKDNGRVTIDRIVYAVKQNPYARLAYDLLVGGFSKAFSTETIGPTANGADGTLANHELVGLSQVVCPNNYSAVINTVRNSLKQAEHDGLDIAGVEETFMNSFTKEQNMDENEKTNEVIANAEEVEETTAVETTDEVVEEVEATEETKAETEEVAEEAETTENKAKKDEAEDKAEDEEADKEAEKTDDAEEPAEDDTKDEEDDEDKRKAKNDISDAQVEELFGKLDALTTLVENLAGEDTSEVDGVEEIVEDDLNEAGEKTENNNNNEEASMNEEQVKNAVAEVLKGYFENQAKAPEFKKDENATELEDMSWQDRYNKQVNAAWAAERLGDLAARKELNQINEVNLRALKEAKIAKNSMTIESMGNFVIPPEMYREIIGRRTDYTAIIDATEWRETDSLEFAWLKRNGDIDMKNVAMCDDGENGNLKPISEYTAEPVTSKLEEMAAVTVVCNAATRFFAVDLLADVAAGYRNDYDRKRAQLVIARLEQAVEESGHSVDYAPTTDTEAMVAWLEAIAEISDTTTNGTLVFNNKTFAQLKAHALEAGVNGPLSHIFTDGEIPQIFGTPYIVVPNDLMPTIESEDAIAFTVDSETVDIKHAVYYADLSEFTGRTSGGLQYDISAHASYEVNGVVRSAYQRNELVLRGSFFRGGAVKDTSRVAGIKQQAIES